MFLVLLTYYSFCSSLESFRISNLFSFKPVLKAGHPTKFLYPMHSIFLVKELLLQIFEAVIDPYGIGKRTLCVLARMCQGFNDIAIPLLWRDLHGLEPLLLLLPIRTEPAPTPHSMDILVHPLCTVVV
jgi:hypothetical protein